jgi:hypothetical protein
VLTKSIDQDTIRLIFIVKYIGHSGTSLQLVLSVCAPFLIPPPQISCRYKCVHYLLVAASNQHHGDRAISKDRERAEDISFVCNETCRRAHRSGCKGCTNSTPHFDNDRQKNVDQRASPVSSPTMAWR